MRFKKFNSKIVEAVQFIRTSIVEVAKFGGFELGEYSCYIPELSTREAKFILGNAPDIKFILKEGDWLMKESDGTIRTISDIVLKSMYTEIKEE